MDGKMYTKVLRAVKKNLCQADEEEILVPTPILVRGADIDHFVGISSRRPARFGRVAVVETTTAAIIANWDQTGVASETPPTEPDLERKADVDFFMDSLDRFDVGSLVGCSYIFEGDEVTFELFEEEERQE